MTGQRGLLFVSCLLLLFLGITAARAETVRVPGARKVTWPAGRVAPAPGSPGVERLVAGPCGPRGRVGPDVPLAAAETTAFARRVTVTGRTAAAIQAACDRAARQALPVVFLPSGTYVMDQGVQVPGGLTLLGAGSQTVCKAAQWNTEMFSVTGDQTRFTRMKLQGWSTRWTSASAPAGTYNYSRGIEDILGKQKIRVDHCELLGFCFAVEFVEGSGQVDHCSIHDNPVAGLGYGVALIGGSDLLVTDNEFGIARYMMIAGPNTNNPQGPPGHFEFLHNHVTSDTPNWSHDERGSVGIKGPWNGTYVIERNRFDWSPSATLDISGGSGLIRGNEFRDQGESIRLFTEGGTSAHDVTIAGNTWVGTVLYKYTIGAQCVNITIDGRPLSPAARRPPEGGNRAPAPRR